MRIAGYWLLYAVVGVLVLLVMYVGGGDLGSEDSKSPIRHNTKVVGAINGLAIGVALVGLYLTLDPTANRAPAAMMLYGGGACAAVFGVWAWVRIARDLKARGRSR